MLEEFFPRRAHHIRPGSERLEALLGSKETLGALQSRCVLVVGTNGKGTFALSLEHVLTKAGFKVGTYTSPHFIDPLERIRIGGKSVSSELAAEARDRVLRLVDSRLPDASFFEIITAIALLSFECSNLDLLVVEAGLGGRLDSTNALAPLVTVLTSVGYDHMDRLGSTLAAIAWEKAFASRRNRPLVCGDLGTDAREGVMRACAITGAHSHFSSFNPEVSPRSPRVAGAELVRRTLPQLQSALENDRAVQLARQLSILLQSTPADELQTELENLPLPGRFDRRIWKGRQMILDNAHNPDAARALMRQWSTANPKERTYTLIFGCLKSKDHQAIFEILSERARFCLMIIFDHEDSLGETEYSHLATLAPDTAENIEILRIQELGDWISRSETGEGTPILVAGSFALVGEVMKELKLIP